MLGAEQVLGAEEPLGGSLSPHHLSSHLILSASPRWVPARRSSVSPGCGLCFPTPVLCQSLTGRLLDAVCSSCTTPNPLMSEKNTSLDILKNPL